jgi:hypothetical protein
VDNKTEVTLLSCLYDQGPSNKNSGVLTCGRQTYACPKESSFVLRVEKERLDGLFVAGTSPVLPVVGDSPVKAIHSLRSLISACSSSINCLRATIHGFSRTKSLITL